MSEHIKIFGEAFNIDRAHGRVYVEHPRWSLVGMGDTIEGALRDLRDEMEIARSIYYGPDKDLAPNAQRLRDWLKSCEGKVPQADNEADDTFRELEGGK